MFLYYFWLPIRLARLIVKPRKEGWAFVDVYRDIIAPRKIQRALHVLIPQQVNDYFIDCLCLWMFLLVIKTYHKVNKLYYIFVTQNMIDDTPILRLINYNQFLRQFSLYEKLICIWCHHYIFLPLFLFHLFVSLVALYIEPWSLSVCLTTTRVQFDWIGRCFVHHANLHIAVIFLFLSHFFPYFSPIPSILLLLYSLSYTFLRLFLFPRRARLCGTSPG